jgi:hypothetical protein
MAPFFMADREARAPSAHGIQAEPDGRAHGQVAGSAARVTGRDQALGALSLRGADLQTACSPYDLSAIARAVDAFLGELGASTVSTRSVAGPWSEAIPGVIVAAVALGVLERERRRSVDRGAARGPARGSHPVAPLPGFPGRRFTWAMED